VIETTIEGDAGEHGQQDRGHDCDHAEETDDAHMELRAGGLAAPREP
jgi:hypothetical protein